MHHQAALPPSLPPSVAGGEGWSGHTSPLRGEAYLRGRPSGPSETQWIDEFLSEGRGQPVGLCSLLHSDGGDITANPLAMRPVQMPFALRPTYSVTAPFQNGLDAATLYFPDALRLVPPRSCSQGSALSAGWLCARDGR